MSKIGHLVYIGVSGFPKGLAAIQRQKLVSKGLIAAGWEVTILCSGSVHQPNENIPKTGIVEGIAYKYLFSPYRDSSFLKRNLKKKLAIFFEIVELFKINRRNKIDAVLISNTNLFWYAVVIFFLSRLLNFKTICSLVEIYKDRKEIGPLKQLNDQLFNRFGLYFFDAFFPISTQLIKHFEKFKKPNYFYPVIVDTSKIRPVYGVNPDKNNFIFCGAAGYPNTIAFTIKSFENIKDTNSILTLISNGSDTELKILHQLISKSSCSQRIIHLKGLSDEELYEQYRNAIALLLPLYKTVQDEARFPHKLGEYLASGRPVITCRVGELKNYLKHGHSALITEEPDTLQFAECMNFVLSNPTQATQIGAKGREVCESSFDYLKLGRGCSEFLKSIKS